MVLAYPRMDVFVTERRTNKKPTYALAPILKRLREEREGMQQEDVLRLAGWDVVKQQPYYSKLENGKIKRPGKAKLRDLDRAFELEPDTIDYWLDHGPPWAMLRESSPAYDAIDDDDEIVTLLQRVPERRRGQATEIVKRYAIDVFKIMAEDDEAS